MESIVKLLKESPPYILVVVLAYFGKIYLEKKIDTVNTRVTNISKTSLGIKADLRGEERAALVEFRVALEKWEHYLISSLTTTSVERITVESINAHYAKEDALQLDVKVAIAKLGVVLQSEEVYNLAHPTIVTISQVHNPIFNTHLPTLIDIQAAAEPLESEAAQIVKRATAGEEIPGGVERMKEIQVELRELNSRKVEVAKTASEEMLAAYPKVVEQLSDLKVAMNQHVYRALKSDQIDAE